MHNSFRMLLVKMLCTKNVACQHEQMTLKKSLVNSYKFMKTFAVIMICIYTCSCKRISTVLLLYIEGLYNEQLG